MAVPRPPPQRYLASSSRARQTSPSGLPRRSRSQSRSRSRSRSPTPSHRQPAPTPSNHDALHPTSTEAASEAAIPPSDAPHQQATPQEPASSPPGYTTAAEPDTPTRPHTAQHPKSARNLDILKLALLNDLPFSHIPEVTLQYMRDFVLARFPSDAPRNLVKRVKDQMVKLKHIDETQDRWSACPEDPETMAGHEDVVFNSLKDLFEHMKEAVAEIYHRAPNFEFTKAPADSPERNLTSPAVRPDGAMILCGKDDYTWFNLGPLFEFKRHDTLQTLDDDIQKIIYAMHRILSADARRRFSIGVIVENRSARTLFMDRQKLITSERFDIIDDKEMLIHLYLSFAFASLEEAGFDMSVELKEIAPHGAAVYRITTRDGKAYDNATVMCDYSINMIIGRATRIFKARGEDGKEYIIKDIWLEADRIPEHNIMGEIKQDIIQKYGESKAKDVMKHFLTPHETSCGPVTVLVDGVLEDDHTTKVMTRGKPSEEGSTKSAGLALSNAPETHYETTRETHEEQNAANAAAYTYPDRRLPHSTTPKIHYRAVYPEVATPFYDISSMYVMWTLLIQVVVALATIHSVGWVHRDISGGNLYWYKGRGILGDVEYAKKIGTATVVDNGQQEKVHDVKTGTYNFMSVEVASTTYLFGKKGNQEQTSEDLGDDDNLYMDLLAAAPETQPPTDIQASPEYHEAPIAQFRYNPLHDIESIFWIVVYMFFMKTDTPKMGQQRKRLAKRARWIRRLFPPGEDAGQRKDALLGVGYFSKAVRCLPKAFVRKWQPAEKLSKLQTTLVDAYRTAEADLSTINATAWRPSKLHNKFCDIFVAASKIRDTSMYLFPTVREIRAAEEQEARERKARDDAKKKNADEKKTKGSTKKAKGKKRKRDEDDESEDEQPNKPPAKKSKSRSQAGPSGTRGGTARSIAAAAVESIDSSRRRSTRLRTNPKTVEQEEAAVTRSGAARRLTTRKSVRQPRN